MLVGLPGTGKSAVGRPLASALGRDFVDTDEVVEQQTGLSAPEHNRRSGDAGFRAVELDAVREACTRDGAVIATGGGAVIDPRNRERLWAHGTVVWIRVSPETLVRRLEADPVPRPMLQPYGVERMRELAAQRRAFYEAADVWVDGERDASLIAEELTAQLSSGDSLDTARPSA